MFLSDRRRGNLVKVLLSFAGILFATTVVGAFLSTKGFNSWLFGIGLSLIAISISGILWLEP